MIEPGTLIDNKWTIVERLGSGGQGTVYKALDRTYKEVAVKTVPSRAGQSLYSEYFDYCLINGSREPQHPIIAPRPHICINMGENEVLVMEMLGSSLDRFPGDFDNPMPTPLLIHLFKKVLTCLEHLHNLGIVHRDVKPDNICLGKDDNTEDVRLIDLGLTTYCSSERLTNQKDTDTIRDMREFVGTTRYCSLSQHFRRSAVKSDDLESLCFSMMYLYKGTLPWIFSPLPATMKELVEWTVLQKKKSVDQICVGYPGFFTEFLRYVRNLPPTTRPTYDYLHHILDQALSTECPCGDKDQNHYETLKVHRRNRTDYVGTSTDVWKSEDIECLSSVEVYRRSGIVK